MKRSKSAQEQIVKILADARASAPQGRAFDIGVFAAHRLGSEAELILAVRPLGRLGDHRSLPRCNARPFQVQPKPRPQP
jgi:hypothetical protein